MSDSGATKIALDILQAGERRRGAALWLSDGTVRPPKLFPAYCLSLPTSLPPHSSARRREFGSCHQCSTAGQDPAATGSQEAAGRNCGDEASRARIQGHHLSGCPFCAQMVSASTQGLVRRLQWMARAVSSYRQGTIVDIDQNQLWLRNSRGRLISCSREQVRDVAGEEE